MKEKVIKRVIYYSNSRDQVLFERLLQVGRNMWQFQESFLAQQIFQDEVVEILIYMKPSVHPAIISPSRLFNYAKLIFSL